MTLVKFRAVDDSGSVDITYFNQVWMRDQIRQGETYLFFGKMSGTLIRRTMANPDWEPEAREGEKTGRILPRYPLSHGLTNRAMMQYVRAALDAAGSELPDALPAAVCAAQRARADALRLREHPLPRRLRRAGTGAAPSDL
jgi:ATP-dependent DNA helicase RecG